MTVNCYTLLLLFHVNFEYDCQLLYFTVVIPCDWLCWGLTTHQPLWVILCHLPEKGRKEIEEIEVEIKERDGEFWIWLSTVILYCCHFMWILNMTVNCYTLLLLFRVNFEYDCQLLYFIVVTSCEFWIWLSTVILYCCYSMWILNMTANSYTLLL